MIAIIVSLVMLAATTFAQAQPTPTTPAPKKPAEPASAEYSEAFCLGWQMAVQTERNRFSIWAPQMTAGRGKNDESGITAIVTGVLSYVMLQPLSGQLELENGKLVDCTAKPPKPAEK